MTDRTQQLDLDETINTLCKLLVEKYRICKSIDDVNVDEPFLLAGVGLTSIETVEMLTVLEKQFGVRFDDMESWIDDPPSLRGLAKFLVDHSGT